jgi:phage shock protein A
MGIFSRIKQGVSSKANAALDKAIDPAKEVDMMIMELEEGRKKALVELVTYKATAKQMEQDVEAQRQRAALWETRAMTAVKAGDDEAAKIALREKRSCEAEMKKIHADQQEAQGYAISLNRSRKEFETKLAMLKMRKGTLATQISAARAANGDVFGNDNSVWDKFAAAESKIDDEAIASEIDAAMRGEDAAVTGKLDAGIAALGLTAGDVDATGADPLASLKAKMAEAKAEKAARSLPPSSPPSGSNPGAEPGDAGKKDPA